MRILSVDTATKSCSVAIIDQESLLAEVTFITEQTHAKHLMEMINAATALSGVAVSDLDGYAVTQGPGSFTGMRIGISVVKGLSVASDKPIVGVSTLDVLAFQSTFSSCLICPVLDARRGEVYFSRYRMEEDILVKEIDEQVLPPGEAVDGINEECLFIGNGAELYREMIAGKLGELACFAPAFQNTIRASSVGYLSMARFEENDTDDKATFAPKYIRKSDAELKRK